MCLNKCILCKYSSEHVKDTALLCGCVLLHDQQRSKEELTVLTGYSTEIAANQCFNCLYAGLQQKWVDLYIDFSRVEPLKLLRISEIPTSTPMLLIDLCGSS